MVLYLVIFGGLKLAIKLMNRNRQIDFTRYMVVTLVCIIFIFHPRMSFEAVSLFQCEQVDEDDFRMRSYLEYSCYSSDHLIWIAILSVPMLALWVIGIPIFALYVLIKYRNELENTMIKKYLLVIYQGLKPDRFYWEFVNTMRKLIILCLNVLLFRYREEYRLLFGMMILYLFIRLQVRMMPYKREENNQIEMLSLAAGVITLSSGVIFVIEEDAFGMFKLFLMLFMFIINLWFLFVWFYLLLCSLGYRNEKFLKFLHIYAMFITKSYKKHLKEELEVKPLVKKNSEVFGRKNRKNKKGAGRPKKLYKGHFIKGKRSNKEELKKESRKHRKVREFKEKLKIIDEESSQNLGNLLKNNFTHDFAPSKSKGKHRYKGTKKDIRMQDKDKLANSSNHLHTSSFHMEEEQKSDLSHKQENLRDLNIFELVKNKKSDTHHHLDHINPLSQISSNHMMPVIMEHNKSKFGDTEKDQKKHKKKGVKIANDD